MKQFSPTQFFNLAAFPFADIFVDKAFVWEPLSQINTYIQYLFTTGKVKANFQERNDVFLGEGTVLQEGVSIMGPAIIGKNCHIGHASLLRGGCILGDNVHIGHAVEIKHSILLNRAVAAHFNYIGDSILGSDVNMSAGAKIANFRLDKKTAPGLTSRRGQ